MRKIPKKIHYCWFGNGEMADKDKKCIESWHKFCPDYEIIKWDESNYDISKNKYMQQAYNEKKWGFVPDFARLDIIYNEGGIYLDTDVEVIRNIDELLVNEAFMGFESGKYVNPGSGFGAIKKCKEIKELLKIYNNIDFYNSDGSINLTPSPILHTKFLINQGLKANNEMQIINGLKIYPTEYFSPMDYETGIINKTEKTYSIHRYNMSWVDENKKKWHLREQKLAQKIGLNKSKIIIKIISKPSKLIYRIKKEGIKETIKFILSKGRKDEK